MKVSEVANYLFFNLVSLFLGKLVLDATKAEETFPETFPGGLERGCRTMLQLSEEGNCWKMIGQLSDLFGQFVC